MLDILQNKRSARLLFVLGALLLMAHVSFKKHPSGSEVDETWSFFDEPTLWLGKYAPDFKASFLDGQKFILSEHIGKKVIVLNFFATWCGPCKAEMPELVAFAEKNVKEPFLMVGIDADEKEDLVKEFIAEHKISFPVLIDHDRSIQKLYGVNSFPTTVMISVDGTIAIYQRGPISNSDVAFNPLLQKAREMLAEGKGIEVKAYLQALTDQVAKTPPVKDKEVNPSDKLSARAKILIGKMDCPCGCDDKVADCKCKTAKGIVENLMNRDLTGKTDVEILKELNKEFCMKDDHG